MVTLIQLEYVIAVDTYRHFARAAQKCFVTQPTLSMQIKKLEEQLGITIFDRSKQPVIPTDVGKKIIEQSRIVLRESEKIPQIIQSFENFVTGHLIVGIIPTLGPYLIPEIISSFMRKYPGISLHIRELKADILKNEIKRDLIDVGIITAPLKDDTLQAKSLFFEEILIYAHPESIKKAQQQISIDELDTSALTIISEGHSLREHTLQLSAYFRQKNGKAFFKYESDSLEALKQIVEKEGGYTLLPELALKSGVTGNKAVILNLKDFTPLREIIMISNKNTANSRLSELLAKHIKTSIPKHLLNKGRGKVIG
jgi:LysR family hydrogen peroxide-inducible transcriptional activator